MSRRFGVYGGKKSQAANAGSAGLDVRFKVYGDAYETVVQLAQEHGVTTGVAARMLVEAAAADATKRNIVKAVLFSTLTHMRQRIFAELAMAFNQIKADLEAEVDAIETNSPSDPVFQRGDDQ